MALSPEPATLLLLSQMKKKIQSMMEANKNYNT